MPDIISINPRILFPCYLETAKIRWTNRFLPIGWGPWAKKFEQFIDDPMYILPILENLKEDESMFVKKSVANNLNDILKDNYPVGIKVLKK